MGGGQEAMNVTTTGARQGHFEVRFFHRIFEEEVSRVKGGFGPCNSVAVHPQGKGYAIGGEDGCASFSLFLPLSSLLPSSSLTLPRRKADAPSLLSRPQTSACTSSTSRGSTRGRTARSSPRRIRPKARRCIDGSFARVRCLVTLFLSPSVCGACSRVGERSERCARSWRCSTSTRSSAS